MKKKIMAGLFLSLFVAVTVFNVIQVKNEENKIDVNLFGVAKNASADGEGEIDPNCPNGCVAGIGGCFCYFGYEYLKEASY